MPDFVPDRDQETILKSPSYLLAEEDVPLLKRAELRPVRLQLELLKPEMAFAEQRINSTVVVYGSTQIIERSKAEERVRKAREALAADSHNPRLIREVVRSGRLYDKARYYDAAREFGRIVSADNQSSDQRDYVIVTGGGPGLMEAANRGAHDVGQKSIGLNIRLPAEQLPNSYITPELCFQFHYFALRKMHFLLRAKALVAFPGGYGTLDEIFDSLALRQTRRIQPIPIILFGEDYWRRVVDFQFLADEGVIEDVHLDFISYAETPQEAWEQILRFHQEGE